MVVLGILIGCSNDTPNGASADTRFKAVLWEGDLYSFTPEVQTDVESQIGEVEEYTRYENEHPSLTKVWSNEYPLGTKIFKVKNELTKKAIAVEINGKFLKGTNTGKYGSK